DVAERMLMAGFTSAIACDTLKEALDSAEAWCRERNGSVVVCGSLFLAAEALVALDAFPWKCTSTCVADPNELLTSR
ncbi:MAG: hypothetical protein IJ802_04015, partial [Kiritimatiellae bacterium]|nr:hypothetical protein [Kiritimatiellia bacterium]